MLLTTREFRGVLTQGEPLPGGPAADNLRREYNCAARQIHRSIRTIRATGATLAVENHRKSLLAGFAGGVAGAWAMRRFSAAWRKLGGPSFAPPGTPYSSQEWDSAGGAAEVAAKLLLGRRLSGEERLCGAGAVHYMVGGLVAAGYAVAGDVCPPLRAGSGAAFGIVFWLLGDELTMPWLGLNNQFRNYSLLMHLNSLGEHVVYGMTAELVRRALLAGW